MATLIGSLLISLGLDSGKFKTGMTEAQKELVKAQRSIERTGKSMVEFGQKLTLSVTAPLALLAKKSVDGFIAQEKAMADVNAALKSMGNASGKTAAELLKASDALELNSLVDGDQILKDVTANLLTFGNVAGTVFDRAQQSALDMAERLQIGPKEAAIQLGKALNDPVKGITALGRAGIQFSADQKKLIKSLAETGQTAKAQEIILAEVEKQFKGAAAAAADATPWRRAQVAIGQAMDVIGEAILPIIKPAAEAIASLARAFSALPEPAQKAIVIAAAVAAAVGPLAVVFGTVVANMAPFLGALKVIAGGQGLLVAARAGLVGMASAFGPILLAVGAIYVAWKNWDQIEPMLRPLISGVTALVEGLGLVETQAGKTSAEIAKTEPYRNLGRDIASAADDIGKAYADMGDASEAAGVATREALIAAWQAFDRWWTNVKAGAAGVGTAISGMAKQAVDSVGRMVSDIGAAITGRLGAIWEGAKRKVDEVRETFFDLWDKVTRRSYVPDMVDDIAAEMARLQTVMVAPAKQAAKDVKAEFLQLAADVAGLMERLFPEQAALLSQRNDLALIDAGQKAKLLSPDVANEARFRASGGGREQTVSREILDAKPLVKEVGIAGGAFKDFADKAKVQTVRVAETWADMVRNISGAVRNLVGAIKGGGFFDILDGVLGVFTQLGKSGLFGSKVQGTLNSIPGYAVGTRAHPGGLAMVGERGPELVNLPRGSSVHTNAETRAMLGGRQTVEIVDTTGLFRFRVGEQIVEASPEIMRGSAQVTNRQLAHRQTRSIYAR